MNNEINKGDYLQVGEYYMKVKNVIPHPDISKLHIHCSMFTQCKYNSQNDGDYYLSENEHYEIPIADVIIIKEHTFYAEFRNMVLNAGVSLFGFEEDELKLKKLPKGLKIGSNAVRGTEDSILKQVLPFRNIAIMLERRNIETVGYLFKHTKSEILQFKEFSKTAIKKLETYGKGLGYEFSKVSMF